MASRMTLTMFLQKLSDGSRGDPAPQPGMSDLKNDPHILPEAPDRQFEPLPVEPARASLQRSPQIL